jgi:hypothetical protein
MAEKAKTKKAKTTKPKAVKSTEPTAENPEKTSTKVIPSLR